MNSVYWLIVLALLLLIEIFTLGLTTIWFAGGALISFIVSLFSDNLPLEISLFIVISLILLIFTRPIVMRYFNKERVKTNYETIIGKVGIVTTEIDNMNAVGQVSVDGQVWSARTLNQEKLDVGTKVRINEISGVKLIVEEVKEDI